MTHPGSQEGFGLVDESTVISFGVGVGLVALAVVVASIWGKYYGPPKYRGRRVINWTRTQREQARAWKQQFPNSRHEQ